MFTDPELAWCGLTESAARESGRPVAVSRFPWSASGRAHTLGRREGLTRLLFDPDGERLLGAGVVGPSRRASWSPRRRSRWRAPRWRATSPVPSTHPTPAETIGEAAAAAFEGRAINIRSKRG